MTEKKRELIKTIAVIPSNFEYIAKTGIINGTLLVEIERVMEAYAAQQKSEIKMPTEDQIHEWAYNYCMMPGMPEGEPEPDMQIYSAFCDGVEWLRNQIEKR